MRRHTLACLVAALLASVVAADGARAQAKPEAALHVARRADTLFVHFFGSLAGARALLLERQAGAAWRAVGDTVRPPRALDELRTRIGDRYEYLARLFDAENERLLWLRAQTDPVTAGLASLLDEQVGTALGRRLVDPRASTAPARYRVRVFGVRERAFEIAAPLTAERLVAPAVPSASHIPVALTVRWRVPTGSNALAYHVEGRSTDDTTWRRLSLRPVGRPAGGDAASAIIPMSREGVTWFLAVRPVGAGGGAGPLSPVLRYEAFDRTPPRPVLEPKVTLDSSGVPHLRWTAAPEADAAGYHVYRSRDGKQKGARITTRVIPVEQLAWSDTALREKGPYIYRLTVVDSLGNESVPGNPAPVSVPDHTAPDFAGQLTGVVLGDSVVRLRWKPSRARDLREYVLTRQRGDKYAGESWARLTNVLHRDSTFSDRGLDGSGLRGVRVLHYRVVAVDSTGNTSEPLALTVTIPDTRPPAAPAWLNTERVAGRVVVTWATSPSPDVARYELRRAAIAAATGGDSLLATFGASERAAYDDFSAGVAERRYALIARDSAGNASPARVDTVPADLGPPPATPINVVAIVQSGTATRGATVRWDPVTGATSYRVQRATRLNGDFVTVSTVTGTSGTDPSGRTGSWYRVVAVDAHARASAASIATEAAPR